MTTNQTNLVHRTLSSTSGYAKAGNWSAHRDGTGFVSVYHYQTLMFRIYLSTEEVVPISRGRGSMSDKQGVGKILRGYGINMSYKDVYEGATV